MGLFSKHEHKNEQTVATLEQQLTQCQGKNELFLIAIRGLLYFIKEFSLDLNEIGADKFKERIDILSEYFTQEDKIKKIQNIFDEYKDVILSYIDREKNYFDDRENEFKNIIEILTAGMHTLNSDNQQFHAGIYAQSAKLEQITYLNDIRRIKEELQQEVEDMRQAIQKKQHRDAQHLQALAHEVESLRSDLEEAQSAFSTDGLTGAFNRLAFDTHIRKLVERHGVTPTPFALLMLDVDDFKRINDTYGHPVGDRVLLAMVQQCRVLIRQDDFLARYGGEEFVIILPAVSLRQALKKARALCKAVAAARYTIDPQQPRATVSFTVSIGVSTLHFDDTVVSVVERADKALYEAKRLGKNRAISEKQVP